jgi:hypothetical protein
MRFKLSLRACPGWLAVVGFVLIFTSAMAAQAKDLKFQALLIWATNADKSPNPKHKPVDPEIQKKLKELPLKWANYFQESRETFTVPKGGAEEATLSEQCKIKVKDIDGKNIEISQIGKGVPTLKRIEPLPKGEMLVLGGNAPDSTGWLVVLKRVE